MVLHQLSEEKKALTVMAHDLKAPLSAIVNLLDVINKGYVTDTAKILELTARAGQKAETVIMMLDDILDYAFLANKAMLQRRKVDLFEVLSESISTILPFAQTHNVSLNHPPSGKGKFIFGNYTFLLRSFNNLLMNAVKYNKEAGRIDITWHLDAAKNALVIHVEDTGIGIAPEDLGKVFKIFERGKKARKNIDGSLGLGLSLVKQIIEDHYGTIELTSTLGVGTKIIVTLPLMKEKEGGVL